MDKTLVQKLIVDMEQIENDANELFGGLSLGAEKVQDETGKKTIYLVRWESSNDVAVKSRQLRRNYEAWFHAAWNLVKDYLPYQSDEFRSYYETMISYLTLNRFAATSETVASNKEQLQQYARSYLAEFISVIDAQANLIRSLTYLPEKEIESSYRCFLTGFPAPYNLRENPKLVFSIMPFAKSFDDIYQLGIKEVVKEFGLICKRADEIIHTQNVICTAICQPIRAARFVVADITGRSPNVFYELGLTHARSEDKEQLQKHVIIITQNMDDIPFDLRSMNIIHYESIGSLREKLRTYLINYVEDVTT